MPSHDDPQAYFDELFRAHQERLVKALTLVSGDREAAADAVQEAFVRAHVKWKKISKYDDPVGWVRRVAINRLKDEHRRNGRKRRAVDRLAADPTAGGADGIDQAGREVVPTLMRLPRQQRLCVALYYVDGLPVKDIAAALDIAEGSVRSNLHDGRSSLRSMFELDPIPKREEER